MPVGKRDFNSSTRKNIKSFANRLNEMKIKIHHKDFDKLKLSTYEDPFVYCDPPYYLGIASYNESDGWTQKDEIIVIDSFDMPVDFYEFVKNEYGVNKKKIINSIPIRIAVENEKHKK